MNAPFYSRRSCPCPTARLNWQYEFTWQTSVIAPAWLPDLQKHSVADGILVLEYESLDSLRAALRLRSRSTMSPQAILQRLRGRFQALLRSSDPKAIAEVDQLRSFGQPNLAARAHFIEQLRLYFGLAPKTLDESRFQPFQFTNPDVDFHQPQSLHQRNFWYQLHLVLPFADLNCPLDTAQLEFLWQMLAHIAQHKQHGLAQAQISANYLHCCLRAFPQESPEEIALGYMNELAKSLGEQRIFHPNYLVETGGDEQGWMGGELG